MARWSLWVWSSDFKVLALRYCAQPHPYTALHA
jgi:hypothetical protein